MYSDYISEGEITKALLNDYVYTFVRNACKAESRHKNLVISKVIDTMRINGFYDLKSDEARELYRSTFNAAVRLNNGSFSDIINNPCGGYGVSWSNALNASLKEKLLMDVFLAGMDRLRISRKCLHFPLQNPQWDFHTGMILMRLC